MTDSNIGTIPPTIVLQARELLADALDLMAEAGRLVHLWNSLETTASVLTHDHDQQMGVDDTSLAWQWGEDIGLNAAGCVLIATAENMLNGIGSVGSCLTGKPLFELRQMFAPLLADGGGSETS